MFQSMLRMQHSFVWSANICVRKMATGVDKALLSKLRKKTGFTFINCKKALEQFDNDIVQAEKWLREQAQKEGWNKATKLQNRPMSQGLVGLVGDKTSATMLEVNCETDFVARNSKFVSLVSDLTQALGEHFSNLPDRKVSLESSALGKVMTPKGQSLADLVAMEVGNVGENMALRRAVHLRATENNFLSTYIHLSGAELRTNTSCQVGKFGAVLELRQLPESDSSSSSSSDSDSSSDDESSPLSLDEACRQMSQHVVGMNPKRVGDLEVESETEDSVVSEGIKTENSDNIQENSEVEQGSDKKEEDDLMSQEFLLEPGTTVRHWLKQNRFTVEDFVRFECGAELRTNTSCQVGKFGAVLELRQLPESDSSSSSFDSDSSSDDESSPLSLDEACRQMSQHVVGMNPKRVGDLEVESETEDSVVSEGIKTDNSDNIQENSEVEQGNDKKEEDDLMSQEFLLEPGTTVRHWLKQNRFTVEDFVRFECGEDLGDD